jgi:phage terminase large subunit-like protein
MKAWCDELAAWRKLLEAWNNLMFGLRLGKSPQAVVTTTPRPLKVLKDIIARSTTHVTTESTTSNVDNLAPQWADEVITQFAGTRLGRQELGGELLDDNPNALWTRDIIDDNRVIKFPDNLDSVVVAIDPPAAEDPDENTAEAGILVGGRKGRRQDNRSQAYILDDLSFGMKTGSKRAPKPEAWASTAISAYHKYKADKIVAEANNGGAMVKFTIQAIDPSVKVELVHASRGKTLRAEPVATLYEGKRVHHVDHFAELEDQQCEWEPGMPSPDRLDAVVWLLTDLMLGDLPVTSVWKSSVR